MILKYSVLCIIFSYDNMLPNIYVNNIGISLNRGRTFRVIYFNIIGQIYSNMLRADKLD